MAAPEHPQQTLSRYLAEAETHLAGLVGNSSLCAIGKQGNAPNAVKYAEGRYVALRAARGMAGESPANVKEKLKLALTAAEESLRRYQTAKIKSNDWLSYYQGEVDGYQTALELFLN